MNRLAALAFSSLTLLACKGRAGNGVSPAAESAVLDAGPPGTADAGVRTTRVADAGSSSVASSGVDGGHEALLGPVPAPLDGSTRGCRSLLGPLKLPLRVPSSLELRGDKVDVLLNEDGRARVVSVAVGPPVPAAAPEGLETPEGTGGGGGLSIPCVSAGGKVFCPDRSGAVHRTTRGQSDDRVVASSRPSSRIAAASFGAGHVALGYLASRQTSEGWVSEAWLAIDDERPQRASEDGSGATSLALAPHGSELLVLMIDARTALTAMHARPAKFERALALGEDAVVFVGGPGDRRTRGAIAVPPSGPAWAFLPISKDVGTFGLATVRVDEPPRVDEPVAWSIYPNGLDPAPIAAAWSPGREPTVWVARVRPRSAEPSSPRVLEVGPVERDGGFVARDVVPTTGNPTDATLAMDAHGTLWLGWVDSGGSWLARMVCR